MDYTLAATELMRKAFLLLRTKTQQKLGQFTQGECFLLQQLLTSDRPLTPRELADSLGASSARIAALLNALQAKAMIVRKSSPTDGRRVLVSITPAGRDKAQRQLDAIRTALSGTLAQLGERDAQEYLRITGRILEIATRN